MEALIERLEKHKVKAKDSLLGDVVPKEVHVQSIMSDLGRSEANTKEDREEREKDEEEKKSSISLLALATILDSLKG